MGFEPMTSAITVQCSLVFFTICGYIMNLQCYRLPVGLIARLVDHCTGIAGVMGPNRVQAGNLFRL